MTGPPAAMTYLCTLDLPDAWFDELSRRVPDVCIVRASPSQPPPTDVVAATTLLHTSEWFPDATAAPSLRCVQLDTSGVDHVRGTSLWRTDVPIATLGGIAPVPMAEHTLLSILALAHQMPRIDQLRRSRSWPSNAERLALLTPRQLAGATLGIVGYGRIGREISRLAAALGMRVLGLRRTAEARRVGEQFDTGRLDEGDDATVVQPMERLAEVLAATDVLVVVVPLTELSRGMIGAAELDRLPHGALVVNVARGGIVDEAALLERVRDGRIGGVALDVFDHEPLPADSVWWSEPGVLVTPHVAGLTPRYHEHTLDLVVENLIRVATGRPVLNEVDRAAGY